MSLASKAELPSTRLNLPEMRRRRGISLQTIIDRTKIASLYLRAIESEQFQVLPGRIYSVNYIRQYAEAIDYDADTILSLYREKMRGSDHLIETAPAKSSNERATPPRSRIQLWLYGSRV